MHLGIIMDGNRRWAEEKRLPAFEGHCIGAEKVKELIRWCVQRDVKYLTLYAFSTENWRRTKEEVGFLMKLIEEFLKKNLGELQKEEVKLNLLGDKNGLSADLIKIMEEAELTTQNNERITVNILFNYGGRAEILQAVRRIIEDGLKPENLNAAEFEKRLYTAGQPEADLIIRTGGEQRLSNFLTWQTVYAELYFCQKYWPDFSEEDLSDALLEYSRRQRRIGK